MLLTATANMGPMQRAGEPLPFGYGLNVDDPTIHEQLGMDMLSDMPAGPDLLNQNQNGLLSNFFQNFGGASTGALSFGEGVFADYDFSAALLVNDHTSLDMFGAHWNPSVETRPQHANSDAHIYPGMNQPTRDDIEAARALTLPRAPEGASHDGMQLSPTHQVPVHLHHDPSFMFNPTPASVFPRESRPSRPAPGLQFGTDSNFSGNTHYSPPAVRDQSERLARQQMETLACLDRVESAAPTRATSPVQWAPEGTGARGLGTTTSPLKLQTANIPSATISKEREGPSPRSAKRRKSCKSAHPDEEDERPPLSSVVTPSTGLPSPANSNQPSLPSFSQRQKQQHNSDEPAGSGGKRKRQLASAPKPPRENLTADQKRNNHIMSEQKRRNIIKTGFDQLNLVVPALKGGGFSKANVLKQAALWLEEIEQGNKLLQRLLDGEADE